MDDDGFESSPQLSRVSSIDHAAAPHSDFQIAVILICVGDFNAGKSCESLDP